MECHECGRQVARGDRFCTGCGTSLQGVTDTTQIIATVDGGDDRHGRHGRHDGDRDPAEPTAPVDDDAADVLALEPAWAPTGAVPVTTDQLPATEPITEVHVEAAVATDPTPTPPVTTPYDFAEREQTAVTGEVAAQAGTTAQMPTVVVAAQPAEVPIERSRFSFGAVTLIALLTGAASLAAMFATMISITSDVRLVVDADTPAGFRTGTWILDDLADNLSIAGLIAVVSMVAGGVASGFRWRWGSGLAGGAGLAMAGLAAVAVGLAQMPIDAAHSFAALPSDTPFVLTITRDVGYWMIVAAGALGVILFFASVNDAFGDHRPGLNPWIAALGALAVVVATTGPLLPEERAVFSDNWYLVEGPGEAPALLLAGRLVQLGLLAFGGVIGFLCVRRWGLGLAAGVSLPVVWLTVSVLFDLSDRPIGPGYRNPGAVDMHVHGVTIIGAAAIVGMLVLGAVAAYDQSRRLPH